MTMQQSRLSVDELNDLIVALRDRSFTVIGPVQRGNTIVLDTIGGTADLPTGVRDEQSPGRYRLNRNGSEGQFVHTTGPVNWKRYLLPPVQTIGRSSRNGSTTFHPGDAPAGPLAFLGVRPCDLAALSILDRVFLHGAYTDPTYAAARARMFIVAVNCTEPGGTCFCASLGTGPAARQGFDLSLTEVESGGEVVYLCTAGTDRGSELVSSCGWSAASAGEVQAAADMLTTAAARMGRSVSLEGLSEVLIRSYDDPRWEETGNRCLSCANCTLVCPTCFCTTVEDHTDLSGKDAARVRRWDSCFTLSFSYIHGGSVRQSASSRYRQWLTHKFGTWPSQFGMTGCVGCGRCITWCPVGIDITREIATLRNGTSVSSHEETGD